MSSSEFAIRADRLGKVYRLYDRPVDRLKQMLSRGRRRYGREFHALEDVSFELKRGEVLGLVGRNGAGKSTLLQMICGTLNPSTGSVAVNGRVAALLELGAGFNPDFSGRENVYLNASVLGLSRGEIDARYDAIVAFSGIGDFIHQPVRTYSSGMYVRLAFAIATSVDPEILVVDEALSVGDGEFARKSFDRIMQLKDGGATILFCSHSLFQIESICTTAIWLDRGRLVAAGEPKRIVTAYQAYLDEEEGAAGRDGGLAAHSPQGHARLTRIRVAGRDVPTSARPVVLHSQRDTLEVAVEFASDPNLPAPSAAVTLHTPDQRIVASAGAWNDGVELVRDDTGRGLVAVSFAALPLLKGRYTVSAYLFCERGLHQYDVANHVATVEVRQDGIEQGVVHLPHAWHVTASLPPVAETSAGAPAGGTIRVAEERQALDVVATAVQALEVGEVLPAEIAALLDGEHAAHALGARLGLEHDTITSRWRLARLPRWRIGWAYRSDRAQWMRLFRAAFGYDMDVALWQWKYASQPQLGTAAYRNGDMVAFYGGLPRRVCYFGRDATAIQIGDVMVAPSERGLMTRAGPFQMVAATFFEQSIGYGRQGLFAFGFPTIKHMRLGERLGLYAQVDALTELRWPAHSAARDWRIFARPLTARMAPAVDALWRQMADALSDTVIGVRDWEWLARRYLEHPTHRYMVLLVRRRPFNTPVGVVVLRDRDEEGVELVDLVAPPERFRAVLDVACRFARRFGRQEVFCWITASQVGRLEADSPRRQPLPIAVPCSIWSPGPTPDELRDRWWLMAGDTDFR